MDDVRFETIFEQSFGPIVDYWFYSKVAGATHRNKDRTLRSRIISRCQEFEQLDLVPEPDNPFDAHATAIVRRETGEQLGYVQARAAAEIARLQGTQVDRGPEGTQPPSRNGASGWGEHRTR